MGGIEGKIIRDRLNVLDHFLGVDEWSAPCGLEWDPEENLQGGPRVTCPDCLAWLKAQGESLPRDAVPTAAPDRSWRPEGGLL